MPERRIKKRVPAKFKVSYIHEEDYLISFSKDISADGMFLYTKNPPPVGDTPMLTFSIDDLREISVTARVIWVNRARSETDSGIGVQFLDASPLLKKAILQFVNRVAIIEKESIWPDSGQKT